MEYYNSRKKEGAPTLCDSMDGTGEQYAKWNKPGGEGQIPYDLTFTWKWLFFDCNNEKEREGEEEGVREREKEKLG